MGTKKKHGTGRGFTTARARLSEHESAALDSARAGLSISDFIVICSSPEIVDSLRAAGWTSVPEFIEALTDGAVKTPKCPRKWAERRAQPKQVAAQE